jgi:hypothetical protein
MESAEMAVAVITGEEAEPSVGAQMMKVAEAGVPITQLGPPTSSLPKDSMPEVDK